MRSDHVPPATARLRFRPLDEHDVDALVLLDADPEVTKYVSSQPPPDHATFRDEILPRWNDSFAASSFGFFAALDREADEDFLGWFHLRPEGDDASVLDLGYRLKRAAWGRGLATEGGRALIAWGFSFPTITRITGHCLEGNRASARVLEKCGMRCVGRFVAPASVLPGWDEERRRAVGFAVERAEYSAKE